MDKYKKLETFINTLSEEYFFGIQDQKDYLKASNKIPLFRNSYDRQILNKYSYVGIPSIMPNYRKIANDFPEYGKIINKLKLI